MAIGIIAIVLLGTALLFWFLASIEKKTPEEIETEKRLEDEHIYDPISGAKMTLEEAERGHYMDHDHFARVKSDEEIEQNYGGDRKEVEYISRHFIKLGITEVADDHPVEFLLRDSDIAKGFDNLDVHYLWEYKPDMFIALVYISNSFMSGPMYFEHELVVVTKKNSQYRITGLPGTVQAEEKGDWRIIRFPGVAKYKDLKTLVNVTII